jgi:hypothetical protein
VGGVTGAISAVAAAKASGQPVKWQNVVGAAVGGAASSAVGTLIDSMPGGPIWGAALKGAVAGAVNGAVTSFVSGALTMATDKNSGMTWSDVGKNVVVSTAAGAATGFVAGAIAGAASEGIKKLTAPKQANTDTAVLEKTYQTYTKTNSETGEVYSGRTSGYADPRTNIAARDAGHHMNSRGFGKAVLDQSSTSYAAIRGREQMLIEYHGGAQSMGGSSGNVINGVSPKNPNLSMYLEAAINLFGDLTQ